MSKLKVGDEFMLRTGVLVTVKEYKSCIEILVSDSHGNEQLVDASSLRKGSIRWKSLHTGLKKIYYVRKLPLKYLGKRFLLSCGVEVEVIKYESFSKVTVSDDEGNKKIVSMVNLKDGSANWEEFGFFSKGKLQVVKDMSYVYAAKVDGEFVYIGKGKGSRYKHVSSGGSHVRELNRLYFQQRPAETVIIKDGLTDTEAIQLEYDLIKEHYPKFNTVNNKPYSKSFTV